MAFVFSGGTLATMQDFIIAVKNFAIANAGFVDEGVVTVSTRPLHRISKGGIYYSFHVYENHTFPFTGTAYAGPASFLQGAMSYVLPTTTFSAGNILINSTVAGINGQTTCCNFSAWKTVSNFTNYHLYTDGNAVHAILETSPSVFAVLSFGKLIKFGTWDGGEYMCGYHFGNGGNPVSWGASVDYDYQGPFFEHVAGTANRPIGGYVRVGNNNSSNDFTPLGSERNVSPNSYFGLGALNLKGLVQTTPDGDLDPCLRASDNNAVLMPVHIRIRKQQNVHTAANSSLSLEMLQQLMWFAGYIPNISIVNITNISPGTLLSSGWRAFPVAQKTGGSANASLLTGRYGLAFNEV